MSILINDKLFVTNEFQEHIKSHVINKIFPVLNSVESNLLVELLTNIINVIAITFNFNNKDDRYMSYLAQNNSTNLIGLLLLLLPYINDDDNSKKRKLKSFEELYIEKEDKTQTDINIAEPKYVYSNIQYGRCNRDNKLATEIVFTTDFLMHNYYLLLETIQTSANKLYINWYNIMPIYSQKTYSALDSLDSLESSDLYKLTQEAFDKGTISYWNPYKDSVNKLHTTYGGLFVGDIYNTITNDLFYAIKNFKWLIYDINIDDNIYRIVDILSLMIGKHNDDIFVNNFINNVYWEDLDLENQIFFEQKWNMLLLNATENTSFNAGQNLIIPSTTIQNILVYITFAYDNYHKYEINIEDMEDIKDSYKPIRQVKPDKSFKSIYYNLKSIFHGKMYNYLRDTYMKFKYTYYGKKTTYHEPKKSLSVYTEKINSEKTETVRTLKNIYNYAKSFCHKNDSDFTPLPIYWKSLSQSEKQTIMDRLNNKFIDKFGNTLIDWFNIKNYIKRIYANIANNIDLINEINEKIYTNISNDLHNFIFDIMIFKGVLSKFVPELSLNNNERDSKDINDEIINRIIPKYQDKQVFHFLSGENYNNMKITYEKKRSKSEIQEDPYLKYTINSNEWHKTYAMNWVSQLNFFHRYLNNRVIYVTGSTGVGKSTQAPKLFLYALKMIDYKNNGKIICTQPRTNPTENNAKIIATQLGVPIIDIRKQQAENIKQMNNEIEKTERKDYTANKTNNYFVQYQHSKDRHIETVPYLMLRFVTDRLLFNDLKTNILLKTKIPTEEELHTKEKSDYSLENIYDIVMVDESHEHNINMDLILSLMKYTTYYNNSIKLVIISATMDDDEKTYRRYYRDINDNRMFPFNTLLSNNKLDRINVDRRIHISPPGASTQKPVKDIYEPTSDYITVIKKIVDSGEMGDILVFEPGKADINTTIKLINDSTPPDTIAIPYFSEMKKLKLLQNINDNRDKIITPKNEDFDTFDDTKITTNIPYRRIIIVATNIAEASITIETLKFVIDNGDQKIAKFDCNRMKTKLLNVKISESSRMQRRGRVGRKSSGTVYYLYQENTMKNNKIQFTISINNICNELFDILRSDSNIKKSPPLFSTATDPNNINNKTNIKLDNLLKNYKHNINLIIQKQYFNSGEFFSYFGNRDHYDYNNATYEIQYYEDGFDVNTLQDRNGQFHIVHPDELNFNRNILGQIVSLITTTNMDKMQLFFDMLESKLFIIKTKTDYNKTNFGIQISKLTEEIRKSIDMKDISNEELVIAYAYGLKHDCSEEILRIIAFYYAINLSFKNLFTNMTPLNYEIISALPYEKKTSVITAFQNQIKNNFTINNSPFESDGMAILQITNKLENSLELSSDILSNYKNAIFNIDNKLNNKLTDKLKAYCDIMKYDFVVVSRYFSNMKALLKHFGKIYLKKNELTSIIPKTNYNLLTLNEKITYCFLNAYYHQVAFNINSTDFYIRSYYPDPEDICSIQSINNVNMSYISDQYITKYILYIAERDNTINMIYHVNSEMFRTIVNKFQKNYNIMVKDVCGKHITQLITIYKEACVDPSDKLCKKLDRNDSVSKIINNYCKMLYDLQHNVLQQTGGNVHNVISNNTYYYDKLTTHIFNLLYTD